MITPKKLKKLINYNPKTGVFTWLKRTPVFFKNSKRKNKEWTCNWWNNRFSGKKAGYLDGGYILIGIGIGAKYRAHILAYIYMMGKQPRKDIDHINGNKSDNRWINLRLATKSQNKANGKMYKNNQSGYKGAYFRKDLKKWQSAIVVKNKNIHLGYFNTPQKAHNAYCIAAKKYHGEYARFA